MMRAANEDQILVRDASKVEQHVRGVLTPFYSFPVHSLSIPSHSSPLLLLPLTILIPTIFATFLEVPRPSRDDPTRVPVFLTSLFFVFLSSYLIAILL